MLRQNLVVSSKNFQKHTNNTARRVKRLHAERDLRRRLGGDGAVPVVDLRLAPRGRHLRAVVHRHERVADGDAGDRHEAQAPGRRQG